MLWRRMRNHMEPNLPTTLKPLSKKRIRCHLMMARLYLARTSFFALMPGAILTSSTSNREISLLLSWTALKDFRMCLWRRLTRKLGTMESKTKEITIELLPSTQWLRTSFSSMSRRECLEERFLISNNIQTSETRKRRKSPSLTEINTVGPSTASIPTTSTYPPWLRMSSN